MPEQFLNRADIVTALEKVRCELCRIFEEAWAVRSGDDAPFKAKIIAAVTIFLWVGVIYLGRMMPFIGGSF